MDVTITANTVPNNGYVENVFVSSYVYVWDHECINVTTSLTMSVYMRIAFRIEYFQLLLNLPIQMNILKDNSFYCAIFTNLIIRINFKNNQILNFLTKYKIEIKMAITSPQNTHSNSSKHQLSYQNWIHQKLLHT